MALLFRRGTTGANQELTCATGRARRQGQDVGVFGRLQADIGLRALDGRTDEASLCVAVRALLVDVAAIEIDDRQVSSPQTTVV